MTDLYELIGAWEGHYPEEEPFERIVALFSSEALALSYEQASRLSTYSSWCGRGSNTTANIAAPASSTATAELTSNRATPTRAYR